VIAYPDAAHAGIAIRKRRKSKSGAEPFERRRYVSKELHIVTSLDKYFECAISDRRLMTMMQSKPS
jgi:hypothetical protein